MLISQAELEKINKIDDILDDYEGKTLFVAGTDDSPLHIDEISRCFHYYEFKAPCDDNIILTVFYPHNEVVNYYLPHIFFTKQECLREIKKRINNTMKTLKADSDV